MFRLINGKILSVAVCLLIANCVSGQTDTTKTRKPPTEKYCLSRIPNSRNTLRCDGKYQNGILWTGKQYVYDKNGLILRIEIYKEGKYCGDGQIDY